MDIMDVANLSMNLSSSRVINDVQVAVLKKSLDTLETTGDDLTKMMEASVTPNLGQNIDVIAGIFDDTMLELRKCNGFEISREPFCMAMSINHRLAQKECLEISDLYGENMMLMHRGWSNYVDLLRDDLWKNHPEIHIVDFDFYNVEVFNQCENSNDILMAIKSWEGVHPLIKIIPVRWNYGIPFGLLYSKEPSKKVKKLLKAIEQIKEHSLK